MNKSSRRECSDCGSQDRREFLAATGALLGVAALPGGVWGAPSRSSAAETAVGRLYESLTAEQRKVVVLPWDNERRTRINANWHVTQADVRSFTKDQQVLITEIVKGVTSADGYERFLKQMEDDDGGIGQYSVGIFGDPSGAPFEFALTGRHLTLRADGDTTPGAAFGGPIVYGHGAEGDPKQNLFWYQTKQVNEVFAMLDGKQRDKALVASAPAESAVQLRQAGEALPGISGRDLSSDQKAVLRRSLEAVLAPYRKEDVAEAFEILEAGGGLDALHVAFYRSGDLGNDQVWDVWRLESPTVVCHFRGAPHVHAYINVARRS
jgi:hypothetical protein